MRARKIILVLVMLSLVLSVAGAGCGPTPVPKKVLVYAALDEATLTALVKAFKGKTGLDVEYVRLGAGDITARVRAEKDAPKADVFIGGSSEMHDPLGKEGLLLKYRSPVAKDIPSQYLDANEYWHGWYLGVLGIVLNTDRFSKELAPKGVNRPATWDDLLDPAWKGHFTTSNPATAGGAYIFLCNQIFRLGEDGAWEYFKKLHTNVAQYTPSAPGPISLAATGQFIAGMSWGHDILASKKQGNPVELIVPPDTAFEIGSISIIKGGPNPDGAKKFVDFILGKEAGQINVDNGLRISARADVSPAPGGVTLDKVKLVKYDRTWAMENRDRLLKKWADTIK
jgi:iron(III) transport system substrate-binding protein